MKNLLIFTILVGLLAAPAVYAANGDDIAMGTDEQLHQILRYQNEQLKDLQDRVAALEAGATAETDDKGQLVWPKIADKITLFGDLRYRHEMIDDERKDYDRNRHRIRARVGLKAKLHDSLDLGFQLASGSDDPVSTNQTLGDDPGFLSREVWIDKAYFDYHPEWAEGLNVLGGKFSNPWDSHNAGDLVWDSDLRVEGLALTHEHDFDAAQTNLVLGSFWVDEEKSDDNLMLWGAQGRVTVPFRETAHVMVGASAYKYDADLEGRRTLVDPGDPFGNTAHELTITDDCGCQHTVYEYAEDFGICELFAEVGGQITDNVKGTLYGSFVRNHEASNDRDTAYMFGGKLGTKVAGKKVSFKYDYREIEADAVVAAFNDSDFGGGGTDSRGHRFGASLKPTDRTEVALTYILSEVGLDADDPLSSKSGDEADYERLQIDLKFKF